MAIWLWHDIRVTNNQKGGMNIIYKRSLSVVINECYQHWLEPATSAALQTKLCAQSKPFLCFIHRFVNVWLADWLCSALWLVENCLPSSTWKQVSVSVLNDGCQHSGSEPGPCNVKHIQIIEPLGGQELDRVYSAGAGLAGGILLQTVRCHPVREYHPRVWPMVNEITRLVINQHQYI